VLHVSDQMVNHVVKCLDSVQKIRLTIWSNMCNVLLYIDKMEVEPVG